MSALECLQKMPIVALKKLECYKKLPNKTQLFGNKTKTQLSKGELCVLLHKILKCDLSKVKQTKKKSKKYGTELPVYKKPPKGMSFLTKYKEMENKVEHKEMEVKEVENKVAENKDVEVKEVENKAEHKEMEVKEAENQVAENKQVEVIEEEEKNDRISPILVQNMKQNYEKCMKIDLSDIHKMPCYKNIPSNKTFFLGQKKESLSKEQLCLVLMTQYNCKPKVPVVKAPTTYKKLSDVPEFKYLASQKSAQKPVYLSKVKVQKGVTPSLQTQWITSVNYMPNYDEATVDPPAKLSTWELAIWPYGPLKPSVDIPTDDVNVDVLVNHTWYTGVVVGKNPLQVKYQEKIGEYFTVSPGPGEVEPLYFKTKSLFKLGQHVVPVKKDVYTPAGTVISIARSTDQNYSAILVSSMEKGMWHLKETMWKLPMEDIIVESDTESDTEVDEPEPVIFGTHADETIESLHIGEGSKDKLMALTRRENQEWINCTDGENMGTVSSKCNDHYYVANPAMWRTYDKDTILQREDVVDDLLAKGLLPPFMFEYKHQVNLNKVAALWKKTIPSQQCIREQLHYIYSNPIYFLLVVNYGHAEHDLLKQGRDVVLPASLPNPDRMNPAYKDYGDTNKVNNRYGLTKRMNPLILEKYLTLSALERYRSLNRMIINAPYCKTPITVIRGQSDQPFPFSQHSPPGEIRISNSIISNAFTVKVAKGFGSFLMVFHVPKHIPRLYMNSQEMEIMLPAGLRMQLVSVEKLGYKKLYRIKVLDLQKDSTKLPNMKKLSQFDKFYNDLSVMVANFYYGVVKRPVESTLLNTSIPPKGVTTLRIGKLPKVKISGTSGHESVDFLNMIIKETRRKFSLKELKKQELSIKIYTEGRVSVKGSDMITWKVTKLKKFKNQDIPVGTVINLETLTVSTFKRTSNLIRYTENRMMMVTHITGTIDGLLHY